MIEAATIAAKEYAADMDGVEEVSLRMSRINAFIYGARFQSTRDTSPAHGPEECPICRCGRAHCRIHPAEESPAPASEARKRRPYHDCASHETWCALHDNPGGQCTCPKGTKSLAPSEESPAPATVTDEKVEVEVAQRWPKESDYWEEERAEVKRDIFREGVRLALKSVGPALARLAELERRLTRFNELIDNVDEHEGNTSINYCAVLTEVERILTGSDAEKGKT